MESILYAIIVVGGILAWEHFKNSSSKSVKSTSVSDDLVLEVQNRFVKRLGSNSELAPGEKDKYIFRAFIFPWYEKLIAKNRYDEATLQKIKTDYITWMKLVEEKAANTFIYFNGRASEDVLESGINISQKADQILSAFAEMIGGSAPKELSDAQAKDEMYYFHHARSKKEN